jgi:uncharacterized phage protein gp47/JayE
MDTNFSRPTLVQLLDRIRGDINTRILGADARVRRSFLGVIARIQAGLVHGLYGYLDFIARQGIPDTAVEEYMERWASVWGIDRKAATKAKGLCDFTGNDGSFVNIGQRLQRGDSELFETAQAGSISGGAVTLLVRALKAGSSGNTEAGTILTFVNPISGFNAEIVSGTLAGGTDTEMDASLRERMLTRIQQPPHGGSMFDYINWAREFPGVTRAWATQEMGPGTVTIRFMMDDIYPDGIPQAEDTENLDEFIQRRRPVTARLFVVSPTAKPVTFQIALLDEDGEPVSAPTVQVAVRAELEDLFKREGEPSGTIYLSRIREAISIAEGEYAHALITPNANVVAGVGEIPTVGAITWV